MRGTGARLALIAALTATIGAAGAGRARAQGAGVERLRAVVEAPWAREAIARVAFAEAANQGDSGLAGVVYTILNRVAQGGFGQSVDAVVNARRQFEPVTRVGGDWRALPAATPAQRARIDTILNLALDGRLPDLTGGALFFQNPRIVAARAAAGTVPPGLVHFGGAAPSVVIGDHAFYSAVANAPVRAPAPPLDPIFVGAAPRGTEGAVTPAGARGIFVLPDGQSVESAR